MNSSKIKSYVYEATTELEEVFGIVIVNVDQNLIQKQEETEKDYNERITEYLKSLLGEIETHYELEGAKCTWTDIVRKELE